MTQLKGRSFCKSTDPRSKCLGSIAVIAMLVFCLCALLGCSRLFATLGNDARAEIHGKALYWIPAGLVLANGFFLYLSARNRLRRLIWKPDYLYGALVAVALACLSGHIFEPRFRVQWDEAELYDTSLAMYFNHTALTPSMALHGPDGEGKSISFRIGRRPPLYSFLVSLIHAFSGPSMNNPLTANQLVLTFLLFFSFCVGYSSAGLATALSSQFFLVSIPLLLWQSTSGSMDLLSAFLTLAFVYATYVFWLLPSADSVLRFFLLGACASYARYEVVGLLLLMMIPVLWRALDARIPKLVILLCIAMLPVLLLPLYLLLAYSVGSFDEAGGKAIFQFSNLFTNVPLFLKTFFWSTTGPFSAPLNLLGLTVIFEMIRRKRFSAGSVFLLTAALYSLFLVLIYFDGSPVGPVSARLYLLPSIAMAMAPLLMVLRFPHPKTGYALLTISGFLLCSTLLREWGTKILPDSPGEVPSVAIREFMLHDPRGAGAGRLFIFDPSEYLVSLGASVVSRDFFLHHESDLNRWRERGIFDSVYWLVLLTTGFEEARKQIQSSYAMREVARISTEPIPIMLYELKKLK